MEYKLKATLQTSTFNIMKINAPGFDLSNLAPPVCLSRIAHSASSYVEPPPPPKPEDAAATTTENAAPVDASAAAGAAAVKPKKIMFQRKTKLYYNNSTDYQETRHEITKLRKREATPWLLQDAHAEYSYTGTYTNQHSNYCLFVYDGDKHEFTMIPVGHWYKFQPRLNYRTLTTDEAESEMKKNSVSLDRWMMRTLQSQQNGVAGGASAPARRLKHRAQHRKNLDADFDELLHEEHFDDDEEYDHDIGDEDVTGDDAQNLLKRRDMQKMMDNFGSSEGLIPDVGSDEDQDEDDNEEGSDTDKKRKGKETSKLLKKMKQDFGSTNGKYIDEDPYADYFGAANSDDDDDDSDSSVAGSDSSSIKKTSKSPPDTRKTTPSGSPLAKTAPLIVNNSSRITVKPIGKKPYANAPSPSGSTSSLASTAVMKRGADGDEARPIKKHKSSLNLTSNEEISQAEVVTLFRGVERMQLPLHDVAGRFAKRVKVGNNREILKDILKRICIKNEDGILVLKPEFH